MSWSNKQTDPVYLITHKAINGLRSSGLAWVTHLSNILQELGLLPSPIDPTIFAGSVANKSEAFRTQVVCYVDDLLVFSESKEGCDLIMQHLNKYLRVKETGRTRTSSEGGGSLKLLGRTIVREAGQSRLSIHISEDYLDGTFEAFQLNKATNCPPDLRPILDNPAESAPLFEEAILRLRAALGKLNWMAQTHSWLSIYCCLLATGMAQPLDRHEKALRSTLRW